MNDSYGLLPTDRRYHDRRADSADWRDVVDRRLNVLERAELKREDDRKNRDRRLRLLITLSPAGFAFVTEIFRLALTGKP